MNLKAAFKAAAAAVMRFGRGRRWWWSARRWGGASIDYAARDARGSSLLEACIAWMCRTFPEAPLRLSRRERDGGLTELPEHPMIALLRRPNPFYSGSLLLMATVRDWMLGDAYWRVVPSRGGRPAQLWWLPCDLIEPKWPEDDDTVFISHYEYRYSDGKDAERIPSEQVVHFRNGLDPDNPRKGLSPIGSLLRECFTDDEAAGWTASVLRNGIAPGVIIAPDGDYRMDEGSVQATKAGYLEKFGGDNRGSPLVLGDPMKVTVLGYNPQQMDLRSIRRIPEERVTARLGIPAIVVGFGAGLDRSTFANFEEARSAAVESATVPTYRLFAEEIASQLLPLFEGRPDAFVVDFDLSHVRVLQEDQDKIHERAREGYRAGLLTRARALEMIGETAAPGGADDVLLVPNDATPTAPADLLAPPMVLPPPEDGQPPNGRANGRATADAEGVTA